MRTVKCTYLKREAEGLDKHPFPGDLGKLIFDNVSAEAWKAWSDDLMIKVINEYRLNLANPKDFDTLVTQMKAFLKLQDGAVLEVENAERGRNS